MFDLEIDAREGARSLARIGRILGEAGIGLEGGGMWSRTAHYLVADGLLARQHLQAAGIGPVVVREAVLADLDADVPGALAVLMEQLVEGGVELVVQYSDHQNRKVLVLAPPDGPLGPEETGRAR